MAITPITATFPALNFPKEEDYPTQEDWPAFSAAAELNYGILSGTWSDKSEEFKAQTNNLALEIQEIGENAINAITFDNIAQLKLSSNIGRVDTLGYYTKGDGGGGTFYWDSTSTESDNGGTVIQATGVTTGRWKRVYSGAVNVKWFGVYTNNINNSTLINIVIKTFKIIEFPPDETIYIKEKLHILQYRTYILNGCHFVSDNCDTLFESGYISNGVFVSNFNTPDRTAVLSQVNIDNFIATGFNNVLRLQNLIDNSVIERVLTYDCETTLTSRMCYYTSFRNIMHRGEKVDGSLQPAFFFDDFNNIEDVVSLSCTGKINGWLISGQSNGFKILNSSAEGCSGYGVKLKGYAGAIEFDTFYSEFNSTSFDFTEMSGNISINNSFFYDNNIVFKSNNVSIVLDVKKSFFNINNDLLFSGFSSNEVVTFCDFSPKFKNVNESDARVLSSAFRSELGGKPFVYEKFTKVIDDSSNLIATTSSTPINISNKFDFLSKSGILVSNTIPFCNHYASSVAGSTTKTFGVMIETSIPYISSSTQLLVFNFVVVLDGVTKNFNGFVFGNKVINIGDTGFTLQHSPSSGLNRIFIYTFTTIASAGIVIEGQNTGYTCTGIIRHI